ncbi:glycerophosphoryl diester phosphodiesterase [Geoalkalibacter ferrihydriticus]|uniref:Glycerophosphoryl diester phosphodiesterase n=1 Tax=Geoalkalibacter ferrihydriticus TaxID=392333 RepID=A0A1G9JL14_9BACT|nr:glycerophosphodiester phosphodiesterase family protein [Geoalkalibacter ferrihydriticus]SDL37936.1 glycerophosphoryl diester phosphodiesterase [Geoalkalibacter ferrihydriticus]
MKPPIFSKQHEDRIFLWAHRGASACAPENTLAAFRLAEAQGADGVELDVHLSRDATPLVIHDDTLERTTNGRGAVADMGTRELRRLDAGRWFSPAFSREPIPLLVEVLEWAADRVALNLELKNRRTGEVVLRLLNDYPHCKVLVSSFDHRLLKTLRSAAPQLPLGFLCESRFWRLALRRAIAAGAHSLHPRQDLVSASLVRAVRDAGLAIYPWTVDETKRAGKLLRLGVDGLFTNQPGVLREKLESAGRLTIARHLLT